MQDNFKVIEDLLKKDERLVADDGILLKNKIFELVNKMDEELIKLLLSDDKVKEMFFCDVDGIMVFDKSKFSWLIDSVNFVPDSYTLFSNDIILVDEYRNPVKNTSDVVLEFPYKDCVLEMDSTTDKDERNELFLNETIMRSEIDVLEKPKALIGAKLYDKAGSENVYEYNDESMIIKGNNLLVLHSLLPKYKSAIKLMYWDILYNTNSDQVPYNDSFKHSSWLVMMKNRLEIAKQLLSDKGCICIQINDDEKDYLKVLMDEVFERKNYVATISVRTKSPSGFQSVNPGVFKTAEYIMMYAKNKPSWEYNLVYTETAYDKNYKWYIPNKEESYDRWQIVDLFEYIAIENGCENAREARKKFGDLIFDQIAGKFALDNKESVFRLTAIGEGAGKEVKELRDLSKKTKGRIYELKRDAHYDVYVYNGNEIAFYSKKVRNIDGVDVPSMQLTNIWHDIAYEGIAKEGNTTLKKGKKPEKLIKRIIEIGSNEGDIVLDAYLGSGTTAAVAHKMGRKFIGIEQLDEHCEMALRRMQEVISGEQSGISKIVKWNGGGKFIHCELAKNSQKYLDRITNAKNSDELSLIYDELKSSDFVLYRVDINKMESEKHKFMNLSIDDKKRFLHMIIDKNTIYVNYCDIDDSDNEIDENDKLFSKSFYEEV